MSRQTRQSQHSHGWRRQFLSALEMLKEVHYALKSIMGQYPINTMFMCQVAHDIDQKVGSISFQLGNAAPDAFF